MYYETKRKTKIKKYECEIHCRPFAMLQWKECVGLSRLLFVCEKRVLRNPAVKWIVFGIWNPEALIASVRQL